MTPLPSRDIVGLEPLSEQLVSATCEARATPGLASPRMRRYVCFDVLTFPVSCADNLVGVFIGKIYRSSV